MLKRRFNNNTADLLRGSRLAMSITQYVVATEGGLTKRTDTRSAEYVFGKYELGICTLPKKHVYGVAKILSIPVKDLIDAMTEDHREELIWNMEMSELGSNE